MTNDKALEAALTPCPFCGLDEHLSVRAVGSMTADMPSRPYQVTCAHIDHDTVCGPVAYGRTASIAAWNRRAPLSALPVEAEVAAWYWLGRAEGHAFPVWARQANRPAEAPEDSEPLVTLASFQAMQARAEKAEREIERMTPKYVAYEYLEGPAGRETAEARVKELEEEVANLRAATNQSRLAFSGMVSVQSAIDLLDKLGGSNG